jgi:starch synthase
VRPRPERLTLQFPFSEVTCQLHEAVVGPRHRVLFLEHVGFFGRNGLYGDEFGEFGDNALRFAVLSVGALTAAQVVGLVPDVVHLNDWQTALAAVAMKRGYAHTPLGRARTVLTVHNLAYQGVYPKRLMEELGLPWDVFTPEGLEFYDQVNYLKGGLAFADEITTVSPTYAREIQTPELGANLDGFLRSRSAKLSGILNGVDYGEWDPRNDPFLPARYGPDTLAAKRESKKAVLARFGWTDAAALDEPLFTLVGRLAHQKGIDLLVEALRGLLPRAGLRVAVLGSGDPAFENALSELARAHPDKLGVHVGFDNPLAHLLEAGGDFFLMPSHYEPCGLNQLYSLRYGTIPIVRATGGLEDTVVDLKEAQGTGFKFGPPSALALAQQIDRALALYRDEARLQAARRRGMAQDFSWDVAASRYEALYTRGVGAKSATTGELDSRRKRGV